MRGAVGHDAPAIDDVLDRWPFAREIALLATNAPAEWSMRIGIYGSWGTGKSSVLGFVEKIVTENSHICVWFNPWGHRDRAEMFADLADTCINGLEGASIDVKGGKKRLLKCFGRKAVAGTDTLADAAVAVGVPSVAGAAVKHYLPGLNRLLGDRAADFAAIQDALGQKRLVVLIDDLDRIDPKLLPDLLFALHEVLAIGGFSYVLALDPVVVGCALRNYHEGFEDGLAFLEKIVQFPRSLPEASPEALWRLAERDVLEYAPDFLVAIRQEFTLLPQNPRSLRSFVRNLWSLRGELERHNPDEINWNLLVNLQLLRTASEPVLRALLADDKLRNEVVSSYVLRRDKKDRIDDLKERLQSLVESFDSPEPKYVLSLLDSLMEGPYSWNESFKYHAYITERPHAVTWKEFDSLWASLGRNVPDSLNNFITQHAADRSELPSRIVRELATSALSKHERLLGADADAVTEPRLCDKVADARRAVELVNALCFEIDEGWRVPIDTALFEDTKNKFMIWAHWTRSHEYRELRSLEKELITRMVAESQCPASLLEVMQPWHPGNDRAKDEQNELASSLCDVLRKRVAQDVIEVFAQVSGVDELLREKVVARRYILFRPGEAWSKDGRSRLRKLVENGGDVMAENCQSFLGLMVDASRQSSRWLKSEEVGELANDKELIHLLWQGATNVRVNPRFFSRLSDLRGKLQDVIGELSEPSWWREVQTVFDEDAGK